MNEPLKKFLHDIAIAARQNLERHGEIMPVAFITGSKNFIIPCPWKNDNEKEFIMLVLRHKAAEVKADMAVILSEIWMSHMKPGQTLEDWDSKMPGQDPQRKEAVMFYVETMDGCWYGSAEIIRTKGKPPTFGEVKYNPMGERHEIERMQSILPEE